VVVLNGVGHDDFADRMIAASEKPDIKTIEANENVPLLAATGIAARGAGKVVNPHTFLSISATIAQVNNIARELGKLDPDNAKFYTQNARAYASACGRCAPRPGQADPGAEREPARGHHPRGLRLPGATSAWK
jgi:ABC-type Zn uptake system ZnuABC Zn-binding protein ZnuA